MEIKGIDISKWQTQRGTIDFGKVKAAGNEFVIIRIGWAGYAGELHEDPQIDETIRAASAAGLHVGLYVYAYTKNERAACTAAGEAVAYARKHAGVIDYPIVIDVEETTDNCLISQGRAGLTNTVLAFLCEVKRLGYFPMWYTYSAFVQQNLERERLNAFDFWQADYRETPWKTERGMWQYIGDTGSCPGVVGACDNNFSYRDYAAIIRAAGQNGLSPAAELDYKALYTGLRGELEKLADKFDDTPAG